MSRPLRIDYPNAWHHAINRARRGQDLFIDKVDYQQFIGLLQETSKTLPSMIGSEEFNSWIKNRFIKKKKDKQVPASKQLAPEMDTILSTVSRYYKVEVTNLTVVRRGIENEPRDVAMYLIRTMRAEPLTTVGEKFGLTQYSSVSSAVMRVKAKLQKEKKLKTASNILEAIS